MGKPGVKPKNKTSTTWSPKLAYAVGLIASDGNLSPSGRHINLTSKDKDQIETFQKCIGRQVTVSMKSSSYTGRKDYYHAQFGDVTFYRWLESLGLFANKSKTLSTLAIPDEYFFDFLRGEWDGDGCIYSYFDPRWRSSFMFYIAFASSSPLFLEWLQMTISRLTEVKGKIDASNSRTMQLRFAKRESRIIFDHMFYRKNLPHLKRKFTKAQKIFRIDERNAKKWHYK